MKKLPVLCICIFLLTPHVLGAECFRPDLGAFLMNSQPVINSEDSSHFPSLEGVWLEMNTGVNVLQWLGVRWWAPEDGAIFVLDCLGKLITGLRIGAVSSLSLFLDNPNLKNAVTVEYTSNIGTGYRLRKVGIFNFNNTKINKIWEHDLSGDDFLSEDAIEARYSLEVSPDGNRIEVKGKITTIPHPWDWKARLAARVKTTFQVYCWDKTGTYKQCN